MINSGKEWDWMDDKKVIDGQVWCNEIEKWVTLEEYKDNKKITLEEYEKRRKEREYYLKRGNNTSGTID